ncbi:MAG: type III secretion system export apparatus subunit SctS [bacterium]
MTGDYLVHLAAQTLQLTLYMSLPVLIAATVTGLIISLLQALTSIQEQTLPHAFKLVAVMVAIVVTLQWIGAEFYRFALNMFEQFPLI